MDGLRGLLSIHAVVRLSVHFVGRGPHDRLVLAGVWAGGRGLYWLFSRSVMSLINDDGLKQIDDLLLSDSHDVELSTHLGEAVVDMRTKVDEVLS